MKSAAIRKIFLDYFVQNNHTLINSSSLVPLNDPSLLFTNAGMVQFKDVLLGLEQTDYKQAVSCQKCLRAGGKHNDLDNVGYTRRHHTFFEMLGNFSFGEYFKNKAIFFAYDFITHILKLPKERLYVTVYKDDDEAYDIWANEINFPKEKIIRLGEKDNFWAMGDTGPCGPCSEIFYDHGPHIAGGLPGTADADGDRYMEIWNLVFMQFNRNAKGELSPLPLKCVDTGMGLERISAIMQNKIDNYATYEFQIIIKKAAELLNINVDLNAPIPALKVIADHIRSSCFLISDNILPSNEGRGYVLRRIIRRMIRHAHQINPHRAFLTELASTFIHHMQNDYPELKDNKRSILHALEQENTQFTKTLANGLKLFNEACDSITNNLLTGEVAFKLYDTYGFPLDLIVDLAKERHIDVDLASYEDHLEQQRKRAKQNTAFHSNAIILNTKDATHFIGYDQFDATSYILEIVNLTDEESKYDLGIVLDTTPFYAESGGQIGDIGYIQNDDFVFEVKNTLKIGSVHLHLGSIVNGAINVSNKVNATINIEYRNGIRKSHSATHLLHAALRQILGTHVQQKGSIVENNRLRFDFSHNKPLTKEQLLEIEAIVNQEINKASQVSIKLMSLAEAERVGAMALFGNKYGTEVRVLSMGNGFSTELCGGTHVSSTSDIILFKITSEGSVASGIRRIEALTGAAAIQYLQQQVAILNNVCEQLKCNHNEVIKKVISLINKAEGVSNHNQNLNKNHLSETLNHLENNFIEINNIKIVINTITDIDINEQRTLIDNLKNKLKTAVILLASVNDDKITLLAGTTNNICTKVPANTLVNIAAAKLNGKGGGKPDLAQAGAKFNSDLELINALNAAMLWIKETSAHLSKTNSE